MIRKFITEIKNSTQNKNYETLKTEYFNKNKSNRNNDDLLQQTAIVDKCNIFDVSSVTLVK